MNGYTRAWQQLHIIMKGSHICVPSVLLWLLWRWNMNWWHMFGNVHSNVEVNGCKVMTHLFCSKLVICSWVITSLAWWKLFRKINQWKPTIPHIEESDDFSADSSKSLIYCPQKIQTSSLHEVVYFTSVRQEKKAQTSIFFNPSHH